MSETATVLLNRLLARGKFRHLQVLLRLAELGSVQRTADAIGVTQSSVTQTLAYLEQLLGTTLFHRHARGVRPTADCSALLPIARQLLVALGDVVDAVAARRREGAGSVRLVSSAAATNGLLLGRLPAFTRRHPAIEVHLREAEGEDQLLAVAHGAADLVACRQPPDLPEGWSFQPAIDDRFVVACAPGHPLRRRRRLRFDDLRDQTWIAAPAGTATRERLDAASAHWPRPPMLHPVVTRLLAPLQALLAAGDGVALLPFSFVRHLVDGGVLATIDIAEPMPMEPIGLLQPRQELRPAAATLAAFLLAC